MVPAVNRQAMEADVKAAKEIADAVVVFLHWGEEGSAFLSDSQKSIAAFLCNQGVDLIVGSHPHVLQEVSVVKSGGHETLVCYSLGNFLSAQHERENLLGGLLSLTFIKDGAGKVTIRNPKVIPLVTHYDAHQENFKVLPLSSYNEHLARAHGVSKYDEALSFSYLRAGAERVLGDYCALEEIPSGN
jgi:poly-gamma-glutamate synthesis protein (capsule biosynthesis protein)